MDHRHIHAGALLRLRQPVRQAVFVINIQLFHGHHAQHRYLQALLNHLKARFQNLGVSAELVDHKPFDHCLFVFLQKLHRSVQRRKDPAPVDIAHQQYRRLCHLRHAHVDDVVFPEVDLCRTSGAFNNNDVVLLRQPAVGFHHICPELFFIPVIVHGLPVAPDLSVYNHLTSHMAGGF